MCTVSFYKSETQTIITSNRDEHYSRPRALPPQVYETGHHRLIYCKDALAKGTWMALRNDGTVVVLLNGAFERHRLNPPYKKSRGQMLLDIINEKNYLQKIREYDFTAIEPFTLILYGNQHLHQCIWNGSQLFLEEKNSQEPSIWSSVTLYDTESRNKKKEAFQQLLQSKSMLQQEDILQFHHSTQDSDNGFIINRNNQLLTFSVTQIVLNETQDTFYHHDIINEKEYTLIQDASLEKNLL